MCEHDFTCSTLVNVIHTPLEYEVYLLSNQLVHNLSYIYHKLQDTYGVGQGVEGEAHFVTDPKMRVDVSYFPEP